MKEKQQIYEENHGLLLYFDTYKTTFNFHDLGYDHDKKKKHDKNLVLEERKS